MIVLNKWDVKGLPTVKCKDAKYEDAGKLLEFDDGSEWYSPIIGVSGDAVRTEVGVFNKNDIVCVSRIKIPGTQYSGLYRSEQHILVYRPERSEYERVNAFLGGTFKGKLSRRELMITAERLRVKCEEKNIDEDWIIGRLIREADSFKNKGFERLDAIKILARIMGSEIGGQLPQQKGQVPLFGQVNIMTIQDKRRSDQNLQGVLSQAVAIAKEHAEDVDFQITEEQALESLPEHQ